MKFRLGMSTLAVAGLIGVLGGSPANAITVSIGLQEAGVDGDGGGAACVTGGICKVASGSGNASFNNSYGTFSVNIASGLASPAIFFPDILQTASHDVGKGTIDVYITASGILSPAGLQSIISTLTSNTLTNATTNLAVYLDTADGVFSTICGTCTTLASHLFTAAGIFTQATMVNTGPADGYSITARYTITTTGRATGNANSTINVAAVPGPVVGVGFPGLLAACAALIGMARRRRHRAALV